jgi:hypothetical protein
MPIMAQRNWRWCVKCNGLWYAAASANPNGRCPAGTTASPGHVKAGSGDYALFGDADGSFSPTVMAQRNWRWCANCNGLWYAAASANPNGRCPAGTTANPGHIKSGSGDYALMGDSDGNFGD